MAVGSITVPAFAGTGIRHFFGTRLQSLGNRAKPFGARVLISVKQVHGTDALIIDCPPKEEATYSGGWDALVTNQPGVLLTVRTADCVPVLMHDTCGSVVAAVHAGWRGAVAGIISQTLARMREHFRSESKDVQMVIGPSAGVCCYEVDEQVLQPLRTHYPYWGLVIRETGRGRALLDLRELIRRQAQAEGVESERIWMVKACTICHSDLCYSYRREGVVKQTMASGIMLTQEDQDVSPRPSESRTKSTGAS
jgi:YfiH family protein